MTEKPEDNLTTIRSDESPAVGGIVEYIQGWVAAAPPLLQGLGFNPTTGGLLFGSVLLRTAIFMLRAVGVPPEKVRVFVDRYIEDVEPEVIEARKRATGESDDDDDDDDLPPKGTIFQ